jgi:hypothetical protein
MKFLYLLLSLSFLLLPLVFHLTKKIFKDGNFSAALGASLIAAIVFSTFDIILQLLRILRFDAQQTIGVFIKEIPVEQGLLNFSISFAALAIYLLLNLQFPKTDWQKYSLALSNLLLGLCIAFLFFAYTKWYTVFTFAVLLVVLFLIEYVGKLRFMYRAYRAFAVLLVPLLLVYGLLFAKEVLAVEQTQVSAMYVAKVPVETCFVMLSTLLVSIYMFEFFKSKRPA